MFQRSNSYQLICISAVLVLLISGLFIMDRASADSQIIFSASPHTAGGPDSFGYTFRDSNEPGGPAYAWEEISSSGTLVEGWCGTDDCYAGPIPLGFNFNYYGMDFSEVYISTNGFISFGQGWGYIVGGGLPNPGDPNNDIGIFGGDMYLYDYGIESRVYYQTLSEPDRLVLEFVNIHYCCGYNTPHTYEVTLFKSGDILSQYASLNGTSSAYVGIENSDGTDGLGYGVWLADGLAIRYYYPTGVYLSPLAQGGYGKPGVTVPYTLQVTNRTGTTDSFDLGVIPGQSYTTTLSTDQVGPLEDGESAEFNAWVEIPASAQPGEADTATIQATSVNSPTVSGIATLNTIALGEEIAFVTLIDSNQVSLVDVASQIIVNTIDTGSYGCYGPRRAARTPDGNFIYISCVYSGSVLVVETSTANVVANITDIPYADGVTFTQSGDYALVGSEYYDQVAVIDTSTNSVAQYIFTNATSRRVVMHPYLHRAYTTSHIGEIIVIDTDNFTVLNSIYVGGYPWDIAVSPDGAWVFASDRYGNGIWVIDAFSNTLDTTISGMGELTDLEISRDGATLFAGGLYGNIWIVDAVNFTLLANITSSGDAWGLALTGDETQLYVGNSSDQVVVIDVLSQTVSGYINMPGFGTRGIAIRPQYTGVAGTVEGHVYDAGGVPIPQSRVYSSPGRYEQLTDINGYYNLTMLVGTYTVTAEAYGYFPASAQIEIITDTIVTHDFHLDPAPFDTVSGTVTDSRTGWPLYAFVSCDTCPIGGIWTDPVTGFYSVSLSEGRSYHFMTRAWSTGYIPTVSIVGPFGGDITHDLTLEADLESCSAPGYDYYPYDQNFEANNGNFTTYGYGAGADSWEWGSPTTTYPGPPESAHSGSNVWATNLNGNYNLAEDSYIESPDINLAPLGDQSTNFSWWQWLQTDYSSFGDIEFSNDGGQTWTTVYGPASGNVDLQWTKHNVVVDSTFAVFNFRVRFHLVTYYYTTQPGWYVDDLTIGDCQAGVGGLVVGNVYDTIEGMPLMGAEVINDTDEFTYTVWTADPAVDDSFYTLFSPTGLHDFTASYVGYNSSVQTVDVISGSVVLQDFFLPSGHLEADPAAVQVDMLLGEIQDFTLNLDNIGDGSGSFEIKEVNKAFIPAIPVSSMPGPNKTSPSSEDQSAFPVQPSLPIQTLGARLLLIQDNAPWGLNSLISILNNNGIAYDLINSGQIAGWDFSRYIMIIIPSAQYADYYSNFNANVFKFEEFVNSGGLLMLSVCTFGDTVIIPFGGSNPVWGQYYDTIVETDHPIFSGVPNPIYGSYASMNYLSGLLPQDRLLMTTGQYPGGEPLLIEREHGSGMLVVGGLAYEHGWWYGYDSGRILNNMIPYYYFVWTFAHDATWLSEEPITGTIPAGGYLPIQLTFDASQLHVPGEYAAELIIENDTHFGPFTVPVTMTTTPPPDWGAVSGAVSDAWTGGPLTATVELVGVYSMDSDPDYEIWALNGSYTLTTYATGYYTLTMPVEINAGEITHQDIALEPAQPRLGTLPDQISMTIHAGTTLTQALEIANTGPMPLDFAFHEINPLMKSGSTDSLMNKHILYDRAHCQGDLYQYGLLTSDLTGAGATIDENFEPIDESTLEGYDILWTNEGGCTWGYTELQIIDAWLAAGGSMFIQGENSLATLPPASIFGISYQNGSCNSGITTNINPHFITQGVNSFYVEWTCGFITGSPEEVIYDVFMQPHVIAAEHGRGKMVVVSDNDFYDWLINNGDNRLLAMNAFRWLVIPVYVDIPWLSEMPEQGSIDGHSSLQTTLTFDASALTPGLYDGFLAIENNDPNNDSPVIIPVEMTVTNAIAPASVTIDGPDTGVIENSYEFVAAVEPVSTTLPLTYTWEADGQASVIHTNGLTDSISFTWDTPGTQTITVTVSNQAGSVSATHQISITPLLYAINLPLIQKAGQGGLDMDRSTGANPSFDVLGVFPAQSPRRK